ncbi:MAG: alpha/beta hydrolase fold domain-containing protein [Candidatus Sericytochromatia bacterium]
MSWQTRAIAPYLRATRKHRHAAAVRAERALVAPKGPSHPPRRLTRRFAVRTRTVDGFDVHEVSRPWSVRSATVMYLHGGGYVSEIQKLHWWLIAKVAANVDADVRVPIYGLAPKYHADDAIRLMQKLFGDASAAGPVYVMGDSAGGGLALAATLTWMQAGGTPPVGLTLIAPWLDIGLRNPAIAAVEPRDPWLTSAGLHVYARAWAGGLSYDDPRVSPLFGDLTDVPPIDLYVGGRDITLPDCRALRDKVPPDRITYHEEPGALHVYPLLPVPEGRAARRDMVAHIRTALAEKGRP